MRLLWNFVDGMKKNKSQKNFIYIILLTLVACLIGGLLWAVLGRFLLPQTEWLFGFMGYAGLIIGFLGGFLYLYNHDFS